VISPGKVGAPVESVAAEKVSRVVLDVQGMSCSGYDYDYFLKKFENPITVNRYLEQNFFNGIQTDAEKQRQYRHWFNNARLLAKVVFYDRQLETIVKTNSGGSGCGSSCTKNK
jgi:hypothetical protein